MFFLTKDCKYYFTTSYSTPEGIDKSERQTCFEIDELIFPIIQLLNQKGYTTKYSCAGHYYKNDIEDIIFDWYDMECSEVKFIDTSNRFADESWSEPYIMFDSGIEPPNIDTLPKKWRVEYLPESIEERLKLTDENGIIDCSDKIRFSTKPDYKYIVGLYCELKDIVEESKIIIVNKEIDFYKFYGRLIKELKNLYTWVSLLPKNKIKEG